MACVSRSVTTRENCVLAFSCDWSLRLVHGKSPTSQYRLALLLQVQWPRQSQSMTNTLSKVASDMTNSPHDGVVHDRAASQHSRSWGRNQMSVLTTFLLHIDRDNYADRVDGGGRARQGLVLPLLPGNPRSPTPCPNQNPTAGRPARGRG